ncbi:MAG: trypsin-like peptidase domain-containing protein [Chitinophagales bacterium]
MIAMRSSLFSLSFFFLLYTEVCGQKNPAEKVYEKVNGAVVSVITYHKDGTQHSQASGVVLKSRGWVVTNFHVFGDATSIYAMHYGRKLKLDTVVRADSKNDILIISLDMTFEPEFYAKIPDIKIADLSKLRIGQNVYAIGSPLGYENTITSGIISGIRPSTDSTRQFIQISAPFSPGSSGGAAVNDKGELIGITTFKETNVQGTYIGFAIRIDDVLQFDPATAKKDFSQEKKPDVVFQTGFFEYQHGHYRAAMKYIRESKFVGLHEEYFANYILGRCYEGLAITDSAMIYFETAVHLNPDYADTYLGISRIYMQHGDMEKAMEYQHRAYSLDPSLRVRKPE